ncbi:MAG: phosphoglucosamine mutase [Endomicrobia bacterium]|nr:phosphoglucosamine mutase [Endomicrobiia bacterium]MCX7715938.1 phosphoglucosamine mutase [Endomicrobiia bacterium]
MNSYPLKISVSGVRGIAGISLTPEIVAKFALSFATYIEGGTVFIATDTRPSKNMVKSAVISGLLSCGCEVVDFGICPTPVLQYAVKTLAASGGIAITASHNDVEWNALIFIRNDGLFLNSYQAEELLDIYHEETFDKVSWDKLKPVKTYTNFFDTYLNNLLTLIDIDLIKKCQFTIVADICNGACCGYTEQLLSKLAVKLIPINNTPSNPFPRNPEPLPENLSQLSSVVKAVNANLGFAQDADGDRLAIVDETGAPVGEEYTLVFIEDFILNRSKGKVVTNFSTTQLVDDVAKKYNSEVIRTKVGDIYVAEMIYNTSAVVGGEGNGGVVYPKFHYAQDSFSSICLILWLLAENKISVSKLKQNIGSYHKLYKKFLISPENVHIIMSSLQELFSKYEIDTTDGIKFFITDKTWIHIRPSSTEPLIRVIGESEDKKLLDDIYRTVERVITKYL